MFLHFWVILFTENQENCAKSNYGITWFRRMSITLIVLFALFVCNIEGNRNLLAKGGSGGSRSSRSSSSYSGGSGGSGGSSVYGYIIDIWIDYDWDIYLDLNDTNDTYTNDTTIIKFNYTIPYSSVWTDIKTSIDKDKFDLSITDATPDSNKYDLTYSLAKALELISNNTTETLHIIIDVTSSNDDQEDDFKDYVMNELQRNFTRKYDDIYGFLNIVNVRCNMEYYDPNLIVYVILGATCGCLAILRCITWIMCEEEEKQQKTQTKQESAKKSKNVKKATKKRNKPKLERPDKYIHNSKAIKYDDEEPFINGMYKGYYTLNGQKHKIEQLKLSFVGNLVSGYGTDNIDDYNINGIYSTETQRMSLNKKYVRGIRTISNPAINQRYTITIQLEYQGDGGKKKKFRGNWFIQSDSYKENGNYVIYEYTKKHNQHKSYQTVSVNYVD